MKHHTCLVLTIMLLMLVAVAAAQTSPTSSAAASAQIPHLIRFSGIARDEAGQPMTGVLNARFALYRDEQGGAPLWLETQNVQADGTGHYTALLGSATTDGVPLDLFSSAEVHWMGVQVSGHDEQPRTMLLSVPYALKAADAETLGGLPASAFVQTNPSAGVSSDTAKVTPNTSLKTTRNAPAPAATITGSGTTDFIPLWTSSTNLGNSILFQTGGNVGVGTKAPGAKLDTTGTAIAVRGTSSGATGTGVLGKATSTTGVNSGVQGQTASTANGSAGVSGTESATTGAVSGVSGSTSSTTQYAAGVTGFEGAATGQVFGVSGTASSSTTNAMGVSGYESATSGQVYGVDGYSASTGPFAAGVGGFEGATTGQVYGVVGGASSSTNGSAGLSGFESATSGAVFGVAGSTNSTTTNAMGVSGYEGAATGQVYGVNGNTGSTGPNAAGVNGYESATTGQVYGVSGSTKSATNFAAGVSGFEGASTGEVFGVTGSTNSSTSGSSGLNGSEGATSGGPVYGVSGYASSTSGIGVFGQANATSGFAVGVEGLTQSSGGTAGQFVNTSGSGLVLVGQSGSTFSTVFSVDAAGNVNIKGKLTKGSGSFKIDDPLDPAHKYLSHSFVESPDMMNVYNGNITTDRHGLATVALPPYFEALNGDFRYQLTVIGQFAQAIVRQEIKNNRFTIKTSKPLVKVSWQVTGIRHDAYANAYRIPVEEEKPQQEQGRYLHPEVFGASDQQAIGAAISTPARSKDGSERASLR